MLDFFRDPFKVISLEYSSVHNKCQILDNLNGGPDHPTNCYEKVEIHFELHSVATV